MITDIAVQFATVFLGAYLAFAAEELRQRRQTREWAKSHLRQLSALFSSETRTADAASGLTGDQLAGLDAWLAAQSDADMTPEHWAAIVHIVTSRAPELGQLLRGEPIALLPPDLALGLSTVEGLGRGLESVGGEIRALRERILAPWASQVVPLGEADRRIVGFYRSTIIEYAHQIERTVEAVRSVVVQIDSWAGAPK